MDMAKAIEEKNSALAGQMSTMLIIALVQGSLA